MDTKTDIDYFIFIYDDDITQAYKGDVMKQCLKNATSQTVPVHLYAIVAECTPKSTIEYIKDAHPTLEVIVRSEENDDFVEMMEYYYNNSIADIVMFSKIISIPSVKRAEAHAQMFHQYPKAAGSLAGLEMYHNLNNEPIIKLYEITTKHPFYQGSPSAWCFHKSILPEIDLNIFRTTIGGDATYLNILAFTYPLVCIQIPLVKFYWTPEIRSIPESTFDAYMKEYWAMNRVPIPSIKGVVA